ncbi:hypothetical protein TorRG33x02_203130 [Trema orientale]|uniref:Uncharacterized protein n=1 Tax=Trema orientale TaxID=63057 RepID=A0A2P5EEA8_TREOI|nr:hypothetical protein TorRG33x02_203130 [Trema orientale]
MGNWKVAVGGLDDPIILSLRTWFSPEEQSSLLTILIRAVNTPSGHDSATEQFPTWQPMSLANITTILPPSIRYVASCDR